MPLWLQRYVYSACTNNTNHKIEAAPVIHTVSSYFIFIKQQQNAAKIAQVIKLVMALGLFVLKIDGNKAAAKIKLPIENTMSSRCISIPLL